MIERGRFLDPNDLPRRALERRAGVADQGAIEARIARLERYARDDDTVRPSFSEGPWHFFDLPASATTDGELLMPSAAATLATTGNRPRVPWHGRFVGCTCVLSAGTVSGSLTVGVSLNATFKSLLASVAAGDGFAQSWLGWDHGVPFARNDAFEASILTSSLNPTTLEARVMLYLMIDDQR